MSELRFEPFSIVGHSVKSASWYPAIRELIHSEISAELDEDDGLFIGFGMFNDALPYTLQDDYDSPLEKLTFQSVVLENSYLKAVFIPELGGRLWSLYDKVHQRDLLLTNTQLLPCNLAIRNAWFAGGVEFNCGRRGHDEQTMSPRFTAVVNTDKYPVLRFYEFQRDRGTPFQYDCFLPDDSKFLYIRVRLWNPNSYMVPMYWWSNIALPEIPRSRIIAPCQNVFANWYCGGSHALAKLKMPDGEGFDASYPCSFEYVKDHFYNIPVTSRKYECLFYPDGYGFCHVSTDRLRGRKLFVWGQSQGGRHWNKKLLGQGTYEAYIELQAGLGRTQQECLPMPPRTAWEWLEGYGALTMEPEVVFGEWNSAVAATTREIDSQIPQARLDEVFNQTRQTIALRHGQVKLSGSGWGALEELRSGAKLSPQLDFGTLQKAQQPWKELLEHQAMSELFPSSYQVSEEWFRVLKMAHGSWAVHYHLALNYFHRGDYERAEKELLLCGTEKKNRHILHALANIRNQQHRYQEAAELIYQAGLLDLDDRSFNKEVLKMLLSLEAYDLMKCLLERLSSEIQQLPLIKLMRAFALAHTGELDAAENILVGHGAWEIPDIREGENSTSQLYIFIQQERARLAGLPFDPQKVEVPFHLDLRMSGN